MNLPRSLPVGVPAWAYLLLGVSALVIVWLLYTVLSLYLSTVVVAAVVIGVLALIYWLWSTGRLDELLSQAREHPQRYLPIALVIVAVGGYLAFFAPKAPFIDFTVRIAYKVVAEENGPISGLITAAIDPNSVSFHFSVLRAYYEVPYLVHLRTDPKSEDTLGPGTYLEISVPETGQRLYLKFKNVGLLTRYLGGGAGVDYFTVWGLPLSPGEDIHTIVFRIYQDGELVWDNRVVITST